jgi:hypothetical protein
MGIFHQLIMGPVSEKMFGTVVQSIGYLCELGLVRSKVGRIGDNQQFGVAGKVLGV